MAVIDERVPELRQLVARGLHQASRADIEDRSGWLRVETRQAVCGPLPIGSRWIERWVRAHGDARVCCSAVIRYIQMGLRLKHIVSEFGEETGNVRETWEFDVVEGIESRFGEAC